MTYCYEFDNTSHTPIFKTPEQYIEAKLKILTDPKGFGVHPTEEELAHLKSLTTQVRIDNAILQIIDNHWGTL